MSSNKIQRRPHSKADAVEEEEAISGNDKKKS